MADIIIAKIKFPNDPTGNITAHQMFIAEQTGNNINLYSVSSILGKERRVFGPDKDNYVTIISTECTANGFSKPSFIDCTKMYQISISNSVDLSLLSQRNITCELRSKIEQKIEEMKSLGKHTVFYISESDFVLWNPRSQII